MGAMNIGPHDIGGMHLGPVPIEANEPVFHADWEKTVFGAVICTIVKGAYNVDEFRSGIEQMAPEPYLAASYYEKWLFTLEYNLKRRGLLSDAGIAARVTWLRGAPDAPLPERTDRQLLDTIEWLIPNSRGGRTTLPVPPRYAPGDRVRGRSITPAPHTRIPGYCQGKVGVVRLVHDAYPLADVSARGGPETPQYLYTVSFPAEDLWSDAEPGTLLHVDLWESYLEPIK
jgi:nitrile hydratase beta subunit